MPRLARTGNSAPSSMNVCWPISGAVHGVAGARIASTSANSLSTSPRYQRRNFCALRHQRGRHHGAGDQPVAHRRDRNRARACAAAARCRLAPSLAVMT